MTDTAATDRAETTSRHLRGLWWLWVVAAVGYIVIGLLLVSWPEATLLVFALWAGIAMCWIGATELIYSFVGRHTQHAWVHAVRGLAALAIGIALLVWPGRTVLVFTVLVGLFLIVVGIIELYMTIASHDAEHRLGWFVFSLATIAAGLAIRAWPEPTTLVVATVLGAYLVIAGVVDLYQAIEHRHIDRDVEIIVAD